KVTCVSVRNCAKSQIPGVGVVLIELEVGILLFRSFQQSGVLESITQAESAIVVEVVIDEHIVWGGLLADGLQRGMWIKQRLSHQPARIRNSPHTHPAAIIWNILDEPIDGVIRVGSLIDGLRITFVARRT